MLHTSRLACKGKCMRDGKKMLRKLLLAGCGLLLIETARAEEIKLKPNTFQILGGLPGGYDEPVIKRKRRTLASLDTVEQRGTVSLEKQIVAFDRGLKPGSILVDTGARKLYFVLPNDQAILYPVGVGREGFDWSGTNKISRKAVWPDWRPPQVMINREAKRGHFLPDLMKGGPKNPLGARALYIGSTEFRIHGTTQPSSIGRAVSSGCIRLLNAHVIDLYDRVQVGALVVVE